MGRTTVFRLAGWFTAFMLAVPAYAGPVVGALTTLDVPGARDTLLWDINDSGAMVGGSSLGGFVYSGGVFTTLAGFGGASGISNDGTIVGNGSDPGSVFGYGLILSSGVLTRFDVPGAASTTIRSISSNGRYISGNTNETGGGALGGWAYDRLTSTLIDIIVADSTSTIVQGVNASGQVVGSFTRASALGGRGSFIYDIASSVRTDYLESADPVRPRFRDINDSGMISGFRNTAATAIVGVSGDWTEITAPGGARPIVGYGLNNRGVMVGYYQDGAGFHGYYTASVPEPESLMLVLVALAGLFGATDRRKGYALLSAA